MHSKTKEEEFKSLVIRNKNLLWHICSDYTLSAALEPDDCFQEVLIALWESIGTLSQIQNERMWVYRVATNTILMLLRNKQNRPTQPIDPYLDDLDSSAVTDFYRHEDYLSLLQLIDGLSPINRLIVRYHLDGFTFKEISLIVHLTSDAVAKRYERSIEKIKQQYEDTL